MRHLLLAALLVAMTGCGSDTKPEEQPTTPAETVSSPETPNGSDEPSAKAGVPAVNSVGMRFVPIQAGTFTMGEDHKAHQVTLTQPFELGVYEVTQEQYEAVMGTNPSEFKAPQNPVEQVSWNDAVEFCRKLSERPEEKKAGYVYRLPTEAEWEYACGLGRRQPTALATVTQNWAITRGTTRTLSVNDTRHTLLVVRSRTRGVFMTCMVTCGSGARTCLETTRVVR